MAWNTQRRYDNNGCYNGGENYRDLYIHDSGGIWGLQLVACVDNAGYNDCGYSEVAYNPYLPGHAAASIQIARAAANESDPLLGPDGITEFFGQQ